MDCDVLTRLEGMPGLVRQIAAELSETQLRRRPAAGAFSFAEHAWHLADVEREAYGVRITRLMREQSPSLPDFPGNRIAGEREYQECDTALALQLFAQCRRRNLERLRALDADGLRRSGVQEGVGEVTLESLPAQMDGHDRGHVDELIELLAKIAPEVPVLATLRQRTAGADDASPSDGRSRSMAA